MNSIDTTEEVVGSPNYSQFLNFESSDIPSYTVPNDGGYYRTSPESAALSRQSTSYPVKTEPSLTRNVSFSTGSFDPSILENIPQACGPEPTCLQLASLAEIEDCHGPPCLSTSAGSSVEQKPIRRSPSRTISRDSKASRSKQNTEGDAKSRNKRTHKASESEDESANIRAKQAHSVVERRYRDNLNGKIMQLHRALSATGTTTRLAGMSAQDFYASREHRGKVRKSDVMTDAMNYVHQSEVEMRHMTDEITRLGDRVMALEKLVKCEDCTLLKQMVRLQLQQQNPQ